MTRQIPRELQLDRMNENADIAHASSIVDSYIPIPGLDIVSSDPTTTVVSAFFPPSEDEVLVRRMGGEPFIRSTNEYLEALSFMCTLCDNLVLFLPPGDIANAIRAAHHPNVVVYDTYPLYRKGGGRGAYYGEPHSWGAWNAKAFLVLDALQRDPFKTSHFIWLDVRIPSLAQVDSPKSVSSNSKWPYPGVISNAYRIMPTADRVVIGAMRPLRPVGTGYWPREIDGVMTDAVMEDIHSIAGAVYFGSKAAMAQLSRAQLILMERDIARGYFVGREEFQLSYLHYEFKNLLYVLNLYSPEYFVEGIDWYTFAYWYMSKPHDWKGLGLEHDPVTSTQNTELFLCLDPTGNVPHECVDSASVEGA